MLDSLAEYVEKLRQKIPEADLPKIGNPFRVEWKYSNGMLKIVIPGHLPRINYYDKDWRVVRNDLVKRLFHGLKDLPSAWMTMRNSLTSFPGQLLPFLDPAVLQEFGRFLFGSIKVRENPQADFTVVMDGRDTDGWFLATNDMARVNRLQNYLKIRVHGVTHRRETAVLCLEPQRSRYENLLPGMQVYTFNLGEAAVKLGLSGKSKS